MVNILSPANKPRVGIMIGDPCGIGPEVVVKSILDERVKNRCQPILIGCSEAIRATLDLLGKDAQLRVLTTPESFDQIPLHAETIAVFDTGELAFKDVTPGQDNPVCGKATGIWLDQADQLARRGFLDATVMAPISGVAMEKAGVLDRVVQPIPGRIYLLLVSGPLRVAHLTDHVPLSEVSGLISQELVAKTLEILQQTLETWGIKRPRIAVAGFNPHAKGKEETVEIIPAVLAAQKKGLKVTGPISPDSVFRHCIEGHYDLVLAMYHDQGHIAVKTAAFSGNYAVIIGPPYPHTSVAHGTAYDIVGKGIADHSMMLNAILAAASLAAGEGFPQLN